MSKNLSRLLAIICVGVTTIQCLKGAERTTQRVSFVSADAKTKKLLPSKVTNEILARGFGIAEGPVWDSKNRQFLFSDIQANSVYAWSEDAGLTFFLARSGHTGFAPIYKDSLGRVTQTGPDFALVWMGSILV
jgi:sugar lactone lactonase YvrE